MYGQFWRIFSFVHWEKKIFLKGENERKKTTYLYRVVRFVAIKNHIML